jgi:glycine betaine/proline transport system permease protein
VLLPMAKRTVVMGVNQTIMAALAMVTIAALIDAPGLGKTVMQALQTLDVGTAFNAGLAIVVMAIVLDRVTTAASTGRAGPELRRPLPQVAPPAARFGRGGRRRADLPVAHLPVGGEFPGDGSIGSTSPTRRTA